MTPRSCTHLCLGDSCSTCDGHGSWGRAKCISVTVHVLPALQSVTHRADALWYHAPNICENVRVERASAGQAVVVASMEPAGYYPCLDNPAFMGMFDLEMSYRMRVRITTCTRSFIAACSRARQC